MDISVLVGAVAQALVPVTQAQIGPPTLALTASNVGFIIISSFCFYKQARVLNKLNRMHNKRLFQEDSGLVPTLRLIPYSAKVSTMCFGFASLIQIIMSVTVELTHPQSMTPSLLTVIFICKMLFFGGAFAAASHKDFLYSEDSPQRRGHPPSGKARTPPGEWPLPGNRERERQRDIHHRNAADGHDGHW